MRDKGTIVAQIEFRTKSEVESLESKLDAKLDELTIPCHVHLGKASPAAVEAIKTKYETVGKWIVEVYEEQNETITITLS